MDRYIGSYKTTNILTQKFSETADNLLKLVVQPNRENLLIQAGDNYTAEI